MAVRRSDPAQARVRRRVPQLQLGEEMAPFILDLALGDRDSDRRSRTADPGAIERVAAAGGLLMNLREIRRDRREGRRLFKEPAQLRVMPIAARRATKHRLGQKRLAPERDEAPRVQVLRMQ